MKSARRPRRSLEPTAIELMEEAVHLLRRAPAATHAVYLTATGLFALALLFFWASVTWFQPPGDVLAWAALALVSLFVVMKAAHAEFCVQLMALRLGTEIAPWSWRRLGRLALAQLRVQPWALLGLPPALVLGVPFGWLYAYGQSATVIAEGEHLHEAAVEQAKLWPGQNHVALLLLSVVWVCAWVNLGAMFYLVPWLANRLLGIENVFGLSGWSFANTTFLASVTALTWLAIDPLVKAFYTLRVFHGRARRTGEDVRVELRQAGSGLGCRAAVSCLLLLIVHQPALRLVAAETPLPPPERGSVQPAQLDSAIDAVLAGGEFRWRLRPVPGAEVAGADGPVRRFARRGIQMLRDTVRWIGSQVRRVVDWFERFFPRRADHAAQGAAAGIEVVRALLYVFIGAAVLLILWVGWLIFRQMRRQTALLVAARAVAASTTPDLRDENIEAAQLPAERWLALAREQAARGEWRLALRALYLATLARLAADGFLTLTKFKTNLDYERELRRRALSRDAMVSRFAERRREFESAWYGRHEPGERLVRDWMAELDRPAAP